MLIRDEKQKNVFMRFTDEVKERPYKDEDKVIAKYFPPPYDHEDEFGMIKGDKIWVKDRNNDAIALEKKGKSLESSWRRKYDESIKCYKQALKLAVGTDEPLRITEWKDQSYEWTVAPPQAFRLWYRTAMAFTKLKKYRDALEYFTAIINFDKDDVLGSTFFADIWYNAGLCLSAFRYKQDDAEMAKMCFKEARMRDPSLKGDKFR